MTKKISTAKLTVVLLLGGLLGVSLMFGVACQSRTGEAAQSDFRGDTIAVAYRNVTFDRELHGCVKGGVEGGEDCTTCHHESPNAANKSCRGCHSRNEGRFSEKLGKFVPKLKEAMHNPDTGCRACHEDTTDDDLWDCGFCHAHMKG